MGTTKDIKKIQQEWNDAITTMYQACLKWVVLDEGKTILEWRIYKETGLIHIIEFTEEGCTIYKS